MKRVALAGTVLAFLLGAWLRTYGLAGQVVQDDEWHAIHKLMAASYGEIFRSFGFADHSIPLTLLYKAMAGAFGLDEVNMRLLQVTCGIALVAVVPWLAWRGTRDAAVALLVAFLVAGAPFLVLYSRFARPYAITTLLTVLALAGLWRWRASRSPLLAAGVAFLAALSAWLHPLSALFPAVALAFILVADAGERADRARRLRSTAAIGLGMALAIALPLAVPMMNDLAALSAKAGRSAPSGYTLFRVVGLFAGGLPDAATAAAALLAGFGAWRFVRADRELGAYLVFVALVPIVVVAWLGANWTHQGHTFARYVFPAQLVFLFWLAFGGIDLVRMLAPRTAPAAPAVAAALFAAAYLAFTPAIAQVRTLGAWYGHLYHHFDYIYAHNRAARYYEGWKVPRFYRTLARRPAGSVLLVEAPFNFDAPWNPLAFYAQIHRQPQLAGFLHELCLAPPRYGELPRDPRFRFRMFVHLDDPASVRGTGAHYLLLHRELLHGERFERAEQCLAALRRLYGEPVDIDEQLAVFDLRAPGAPRKLQ